MAGIQGFCGIDSCVCSAFCAAARGVQACACRADHSCDTLRGFFVFAPVCEDKLEAIRRRTGRW